MSQVNEYLTFYDSLSFSEAQKTEMARQAAQAAGKRNRRAKWHPGRMAAAAACLCCLLTVTAEAAGIPTPLSQLLSPIFGGSVAQTEVIDRIGRPINASDTDNGVTVSAEAIIGDRYNACIVFSFRREDGQCILPEGTPVNALQLGGFGDVVMIRQGGTHGTARFVDLVPGDNELHYLYSINADQPLNKGTAKATFEDLYAYPEFQEQSVKILEGKWKFRFDVNYEDSAIQLAAGECFEREGVQFTITEVQLSPIAVRVAYEADTEAIWSNAPSGRLPEEDRRQVERYLENITLLLTKKDGTVLDLTLYAGGGIHPDNGKTYCTKSTMLDTIVPLEEWESITVGDVVYPVNAE